MTWQAEYNPRKMAGFGERIKALREEKGWKQEDLAREAKVSRDTVFRAEQSEDVRVNSLYKMAAALGVPISGFFVARGRPVVAERDREAVRLLSELSNAQFDWVVQLLRTFVNDQAAPIEDE